MLAGMASPQQALTALLPLLCAALAAYGCPHARVSENGSVFTAKDSLTIWRDWEMQPRPIETGPPWQHLMEAQLQGQRRLADAHFAQAHT
jgi:hypothetical protein